MKRIISIIILVLSGQVYAQDYEKIYQEYKDIYYKAFKINKLSLGNYDRIDWKIGDTITFKTNSYIVTKYDSVIWMDSQIEILRDVQMQILAFNNDCVLLQMVSDTTIKGLILRRDFEMTYNGMMSYDKYDFFSALIEIQQIFIDSLKNKYSLTDSTLNVIINKFENQNKDVKRDTILYQEIEF